MVLFLMACFSICASEQDSLVPMFPDELIVGIGQSQQGDAEELLIVEVQAARM